MTWTCTKCQNVNPTSECKCLRDGCDGVPWKEVGTISAEENAVLGAYNSSRAKRGLPSLCVSDYLADKFAVSDVRAIMEAARAPLEAELKTLRGQLAKAAEMNHRQAKDIGDLEAYLGKDGTAFLHAGTPATVEAVRRIEELKAQLAQAQKPAAPAGLPEVGMSVEVRFSGANGYEPSWEAARVSRHWDHKTFDCQLAHGGGCTRNVSDFGKTWRRLPPAQTSRETVAGEDGVRGAIEDVTAYLDDHWPGCNSWQYSREIVRAVLGNVVADPKLFTWYVSFATADKTESGLQEKAAWDRSTKKATDGADLLVTLEFPAKSWDEAMEVHHFVSGFEPYKPMEQAASPPGEVSMNNTLEWHRNFPGALTNHARARLVVAIEADIRAAVERETAKDKARIAELEQVYEAYNNDVRRVAGERDTALAEVERLRKAYKSRDEGRMVMSLVGLEREVERLKVNLGDSNWARDKFLKERDEARSANREQRRAGVMDAVKWFEGRDSHPTAIALRKALVRGEVLRDGDAAKQERAPDAPIPGPYRVRESAGKDSVWVEAGDGFSIASFAITMFSLPKGQRPRTYDDAKMFAEVFKAALDRESVSGKLHECEPEKTGRLPEVGDIVFWRKGGLAGNPWKLVTCGALLSTEATAENEGVLWCWPRPGMV